MGLRLLRRALLWDARGRVLEVGVGTGRNFEYYRDGVSAVLGVDTCGRGVAQTLLSFLSFF
jgi:hypothetical protein